ncbi:MAG: enoyl-CoA hydratase/isomerase family protein [Desulfobacteraceae bacterium]|jgi:enoyl-CoA hydratase|nr:MAG: enoyl-CoA hydratase/isomerase family protein [Desulfobacteraceae bacterium]
MTYECILYEKANGVAVIRLNRPKVLNAMNKRMWTDLEAALDDALDDPAIKAVVITGEGRAFSTGADLKESKTRSLAEYRDYLERLQEVSRKIIRFEKPTIAAINGYALGSGYELALACDIRIAAEDARIGSPEVRVASSVTGGAMRLLQDLVGPGKARELLFTGENIDGRTAEQIGLVNRAVPAGQLMDAAGEMAGKIAENSGFSIRMIKKGLCLAAGEASMEALMAYEVEACLACVSTRERQAALVDFASRKTDPQEKS